MNTSQRPFRLDSSWLVVGSLLVSLWCVQLWVRSARTVEPPSLGSSWSWRSQPPTVVVRFRGTTGCGCDTSLKDAYTRCLQSGIAYVVVASAALLQREAIRPQDFPRARFIAEHDAHFALPAPERGSETLLIREGRVRRRWSGIRITKGMLQP